MFFEFQSHKLTPVITTLLSSMTNLVTQTTHILLYHITVNQPVIILDGINLRETTVWQRLLLVQEDVVHTVLSG